MEQYILKSALVAEIERILSAFKNSDAPVDRLRASTLISLLSFIDNLEVKEINLNKEIDRVWDNLPDTFLTSQHWSEFQKVAKHFFELGLNASNPLTWEDISDIDDLLDESLPSSFGDELELKGYYEEVLKRFKAQKGE